MTRFLAWLRSWFTPAVDPPGPYVVSPATYNAVAQAGHFLAGLCAVFGPAAVGPRGSWVYGALLGLIWAIGKEFIYDALVESADSRGSDWQDFAFYVLGDALACILVLVWGY